MTILDTLHFVCDDCERDTLKRDKCYDVDGSDLCRSCYDNRQERAYERQHERLMDGDHLL